MTSLAGSINYREAASDDVPAMVRCRVDDTEAGPADPRMALYLEGRHHPGHALAPRVMYVCSTEQSFVGYVGGHLTRRFGCDGELQYLYVRPERRRSGVASELLSRLAGWFVERAASRVCVDVVPDNSRARAFYARHGAVHLSDYWMVWDDIGTLVP